MFYKNIKKLIICSAAVLAAGCASVAVTSDTLESRVATSLGLAKSEFKISDRVDSGVRSDFKVTTNSEQTYACYVTGSVSIVGRVVSDPVCTETTVKQSKQETTKKTARTHNKATCNDLLRAAGKCSN